MPKNNGPLQIRLTEPVIFLKGPSTGLDFRGRPQAVRQDGQPAMVRGLLTLRLSKPTRIRSITIKLEGKARTEWPEGIGSKRMDTYEEHMILSDQTTFFNAVHNDSSRSRSARRALSVGPGVRLGGHEDEEIDDDNDLNDVPRDGDDLDDWLEIGRPRARVPRSSSAMPGTHDNHSWHRDGFSRRPSFDTTPQSTRSSFLDIRNLSIQERGPSPAYTPHASPPRRSSTLPGETRHSSRPSSLRQSNNASIPTTTSREPALSPIASAAPSQNTSERGDSAEAEHRRPAHQLRSNISSDAVQEGTVWSPHPPQDESALDEEEDDSAAPSPALRPILNQRTCHMSAGEVRFQDPVHDIATQNGNTEEHSEATISGSTPTPDHTTAPASADEASVPPPSAGPSVTAGNRAASVRTFNSQFSTSSASLALSSHDNTPEGSHNTTPGENHPTGVQAVSVVNTAHNTPVNSAPPSIHQRSSTETLGNIAHGSGNESSSPNASRRTSTVSNSNRQTSETSIHNLPHQEPLPTVTRQGRSSRTGSSSTIVETAGAVSSSSHVNVPSSLRNASRPQRSASGTPSLSSAPSLQHLRASSSTHREPSEDGRGRKSSKFSLAATLRGISRDVKETFHHHGRGSSKSRSRMSSPVRSGAGAGDSGFSGFSDRPSLQNGSSSSQNISMSMTGGGSGYGPGETIRQRAGSRNPSYRQDDFQPSYGRGGAGSISTSRRSRSRDRDPSVARVRDGESRERSRSRARGRHMGMKVLTDKLGLGEHEDHHGDDVHNWKEFRKGTYNYPISFPIPVNAPPTIHAEFGSVTYRLKASVVRVGALTPNLTEDMEITMIAQPQEDDMEESENVIVERQWEEQMRYQITLGGKAFPIAGTIPISLRLMPLLKCKIHRLTVALEEKTDYFAQERKVARHETPKRFVLLFIKQPDYKERIEPLLPIISDDPNAAEQSPIAEMARQAVLNNPPMDVFDLERDPNDTMYAQLMEPTGPWHMEKELHVPDCASKIKFTTKHEQTNITVGHWLKVTIRVERGDDVALDSKGRRKQFDIIIETPIKILDCRVNPQWNSLPTYSVLNRGVMSTPGVCSIHGTKSTNVPTTSTNTSNNASLRNDNTISTSSTIVQSDPHAHAAHRRGTVDQVGAPSGENGEDTLLERNIVYDRLMSGQQTETGEVPPSYGEATAGESSTRGRGRQAISRTVEQEDHDHGQIVFNTRGSNSRSRSRLGLRD
ncbi:cyclin binding protein [Kwoniella mangroviensis CBS 8886]|uniref:uncharacterized protein n=1 Tax=Kwoniella mangroviensis CBS 8507 TaxID=1296122 RepID=UPI00080CE4E9|nr:cyclin binding protein [Kwoniella mangroviensis CBS 8507]OCF67075.1 cyclin binding protein [Kwoniella mangroviensis CBS 8507]OCF77930.1 cyclin binding protein [Kwoniella mangroviensis CBS 8886]